MTAPVLRVFACGRLGLLAGEVFVPESAFPGRQGRRLWGYLVLNRRHAMGRAELAEAVWGDDTPAAWDSALSALISKLRGALRPLPAAAPVISVEHGRCGLSLPSDAFVDIERARAALHPAEEHAATADLDTLWSEARIAIEITNRGFLPGEEAPWIEAERRVLEETHRRALELAATAELDRGRPVDAVREARALVRCSPLHETGYRLLVRALLDVGDNAEASQVAAECTSALASIGIVPSAGTKQVFDRIGGAKHATQPVVAGATRTFMFADLREYTTFVERHGDDAAATLIAGYRALVRAEIAKAGGAEIKTEGDGFYVVFPAARQALDASISILRAAARRPAGAHAMNIGIGLHAGEPVPQGDQYVGSAVTVAARLGQQASAGELLVTDLIRGLLRTSRVPPMDERPGMQLKGITDAPRVFSVRWREPMIATAR